MCSPLSKRGEHSFYSKETGMHLNIRFICMLGVLMLFLLGFSLAQEGASASKNELITVTDFRGKQLKLEKPVTRIVCLIESALSGLYMLGAEGRVIGISANIYQGGVFQYYAAMDRRIKDRKLPAPGNWDFVNIESVLALKPDLVIIWSDQAESIAALEERGVPVFGVFINRKEDVYKEMIALGMLTGNLKRAEELVDYTKKEIGHFQKRVGSIPDANRQSIYYMWAQGNLETSCGNSTVNDLIELSGGRNVCASLPSEHLVVNMERVIAWNPDLIVMWYNEKKNPSDIVKDPQWQTIKAVRAGRVYELPEIFLCDLWTLKFHYAVKTVAKWAYPELFKDIDLDKEKTTMLKKFYWNKLKEI
jgi:iron complex transport system substrate-binding protein